MAGIQRSTFLAVVLLVLAIWAGGMAVIFTGPGGAGPSNVANPQLAPQVAGPSVRAGGAGVQDVYVKALGTGFYDKAEVTVKKGIPVRFHFSAEQNAGCGRYIIIDGFSKNAISRSGEEQIMEFTPTAAGKYPYHCGMNMFRGTLVVV